MSDEKYKYYMGLALDIIKLYIYAAVTDELTEYEGDVRLFKLPPELKELHNHFVECADAENKLHQRCSLHMVCSDNITFELLEQILENKMAELYKSMANYEER